MPSLVKAALMPPPDVQRAALDTLATILYADAKARTAHGAAVIKACVKVATTRSDDDYVQTNAGVPLGEVGTAALDAIVKLAAHADANARAAAFSAIYAFPSKERRSASARVLPAVRTALGHEDADTRAKATFAMRTWEALAAPLLPELTNLLADEDETVVDNVIDLLGTIGPAAASVVPNLVTLSKAKNYTHRCIRSLSNIGVINTAVLDAVRAATRHRNQLTKEVAQHLLATMEAKATDPGPPRRSKR